MDKLPLDELEIMSPKELGRMLWDILTSKMPNNVNSEYIQNLIAAGAPLEAKDSNGWTLLHYAAWNDHVEAAKVLIAAGAPLEAKTNDIGWTPLHCAALYGHIKTVKALLDAGASKEAKNSYGWTPWKVAVPSTKKSCPQLNPNYNG